MKQASMILSAAHQFISSTKNLLAYSPAKLVMAPLVVLTVISCMFSSCTKSGLKPDLAAQALGSGGGNGGGGGGNPTSPGAPVPTTVPTSLSIIEVVTTGTWQIYSYTEKAENSTKKFSSFTFTFNNDGTITARDGGKVTTGTWSPAEAIFYYGVPVYGSNPHGFFITLGGGLPLTLLGKNFFVSFKGLTTFTLESINPAEDTHVTFTR